MKTFNPNREPRQELIDKIDNIETTRMLILGRMQLHFDNGEDTYPENLELLKQAFYIKKRIKGILDDTSQLEFIYEEESEKK